ncbi:MAG TPA: hypothetical protein VI279_16350 [Rhodocyclaceae bacterium]
MNLSAPPQPLQDAFAWLAAEPDGDPLRELVPMRRHLQAVAGAEIPEAQRRVCLRAFRPRLARTDAAVAPLLLDVMLPLPLRIRNVARAMGEIHDLATRCLHGVSQDPTITTTSRNALRDDAMQVLTHTHRQQMIALLTLAPPPAELWDYALAAFRRAGGLDNPDAHDRLGHMLALMAAQPEGLTPRELNFLAEVLRPFGHGVTLQAEPPAEGEEWLWINPQTGQPPMAGSRLPAPDGQPVLYFNCQRLAEQIGTYVDFLAHGTPPEALKLPREAALPDYLNVLRRAVGHWRNPRRRQFVRRGQTSRGQVCVRLGELWRMLQGGSVDPGSVSDWMVLNESPSGLAMMHLGGDIGGLIAGSAVGFRPGLNDPWSICLVRWARSDNPAHIELGVELIAPTATAVRLVPTAAGAEPIPALLLPPIQRLGLPEALLLARTTEAFKEFTLLTEQGGQLRLSACAVGEPRHQTSSVEVFDFRRITQPE